MNEIFDELKTLFNKNNYRLYMIGSTSRDFLLKREIEDYDFVTDATPDEVLTFLNCNDTFKKYGTLSLRKNGKHVDIVSLRKESAYLDARHPSKIEFIKDINEDYQRRDFTINAIYIDEKYHVAEISELGLSDLNNRILRFIGEAQKRVKEDPLRILRAKRFIVEYNLEVEKETLKALKENVNLLSLIKEGKILEEKKKFEKIAKGKHYEFK